MLARQTTTLLRQIGTLPTSGARAAEIFRLDGQTFLAVPQLAYDLPGAPAHMNGGDSDTDLLIFRWDENTFAEHSRLPVPGGEDAEFFTIDGVHYLATACARKGKGPYDPNIASTIFRWDGTVWSSFQVIPGFFAKQFRHFSIGSRHFLALALGVSVEGAVATNPRNSCILEWTGTGFELLQTLEGPWGYNWCHFTVDDQHFLGYADHVEPSRILRWDGKRFEPFQTLDGSTGRAFLAMHVAGEFQLAFATIAGDTTVLKWNGNAFELFQTLSGPGGREFATVTRDGRHYLVQINFIEGSPKAPKTDLVSFIHVWDGSQWQKVFEFETFGATDAAFFSDAGKTYLVVANGLTPEVKFRQDSAVFEFLG
ncbi:hypothetical protein [Aminobacter sp. AP02]|uniref:hypothetical protein n=1 Tax=Aminobacter sp. AP02 TaxID=2135737 RepID=UPI000D6B3CD1|nr:hypothetical protein [Aminobacter sp. AP02]PWK63041.1 EPTP domain-containing protein [Aminobacter sp. AP02]